MAIPPHSRSHVPLRLAFSLPGLLFVTVLLFADRLRLSSPGFGGFKMVALLFAALLAGFGVWLGGQPRRRQLLFLVPMLATGVCYSLLESVATWIDWSRERDSCSLFENPQGKVRFDPIRGFSLSPEPMRYARILRATLVYVGQMRGNSAGFPDRDDFGPARDPRFVRRVAVFGDSFSAGQQSAVNWPDRAEDITRDTGAPVQFLNFSMDGAGLANWWSVLTKLVDRDNYDLDAVVFAVYAFDLFRRFTIEYGTPSGMYYARPRSWDPATYPTTLEGAIRELKPSLGGRAVTKDEMDLAVGTRHCPADLRNVDARIEPFFATRLLELGHAMVSRIVPTNDPSIPTNLTDPMQFQLIDDIARYIGRRKIKAYVFYLPARDTLLRLRDQSDIGAAQEFARRTGSQFTDVAEMFRGMSPQEIRARFFPYDAHWNQQGQDDFARFIVERLRAEGLIPAAVRGK